ncbi:plasmid mobilization relaxosome protein MobC [Pseudoflavitalea rhizosphaerae]|uniref:plasmid mobilization protein n=1 Tax=Pseudoflavitalea rhizosphaerae TaxID=1884793 RepID=UPI000F8F0DF0|nr:plasmid mobilization relaxosome protein MobC [Pseudoflavitalea rhizosphaerae]
MGRKKLDENKALKQVQARISPKRFEQLKQVVANSRNIDMSTVIRNILENKPIKVFVHDESMDLMMEQLAAIRGEIKAIGININQMAKLFNTYTEPQIKAFYAKIGYKEYLRLESKVDEVLSLISKLGKKWLRE